MQKYLLRTALLAILILTLTPRLTAAKTSAFEVTEITDSSALINIRLDAEIDNLIFSWGPEGFENSVKVDVTGETGLITLRIDDLEENTVYRYSFEANWGTGAEKVVQTMTRQFITTAAEAEDLS